MFESDKMSAKTMDKLLHSGIIIGTLSYNLYDFDNKEWFDGYFSKPRFKEPIHYNDTYTKQDDDRILRSMDSEDQNMMPDADTMIKSVNAFVPTFKELDLQPSYFVAAFQIDECVPYFGFAKEYNIKMISGSKEARQALNHSFAKNAKYLAIDQDGLIHPRMFILGNLILRNNKSNKNLSVAKKHYISGRSRKEFPNMENIDFISMVKTYVNDMATNAEMQKAFVNMLQTYKTR